MPPSGESTRKQPQGEPIKMDGELMRLLVRALPDPVWLKDVDGVYVACNARFEEMFGAKEKDIVGKSDYDFVGSDLADFFRSQDNKALEKGGQEVNEEAVTFASDGHKAVLETIKTPLYSTDGRVIGILGVARDISARKKAETALYESEEKYRVLFDTFPLGITVTDETGKIVESNKKAEELLGMAEDEQRSFGVGSKEWRIIRADGTDLSADERASVRALKEKRVVAYSDVGIGRPDGEMVWLDVVAAPHPLEKYGVVVVYEDVSARREAELQRAAAQQELAERNHYIAAITDHLPIGIGVNRIDDGTVLYVNKKFEEIYGWPSADLPTVDSFFERVFPDPTERELMRARIMGDIASGDPERMEWSGLQVTGKSGDKRVVYSKNIPIPKQNLMISTAQDQTEVRRLEKKIQQVERMESVGRLAGGLAHDFNNILSVIIGHADMALHEVGPESSVAASLEVIRSAGERSRGLTRQLLAFASRQTISPEVLDLNQKVSGLVDMLKHLVGEDVDFRWTPGENTWPVKMDPVQLDQILTNLCANARDAITDVGQVTVATKNVVLDEAYCSENPGCTPGEYVVLSVADDGRGIDVNILPNVFEPFFTTKEDGLGTGLGLATVYGIVKQNGGFINVRTGLGEGATFEIFLPASRDETNPAVGGDKGIPLQGRGETILVVEDEETILGMVTAMLQRMGYRVLAAGRPTEAISIAQDYKGDIHLLLSDVVMPEMNGWELMKKIVDVRPDLKYLLMSGYAADVIAGHGVVEEQIEIMEKPFSWSELGARVRKVLSGE